MGLGNNVKKRRIQLGLTQTQLAKKVGVSQVAIANLEKRDSKSSRNLSALANALQCSVLELENADAVSEEFPPYLTHTVPELALQQAEKWEHFSKTARNYLNKINAIGENSKFFVRVTGDSMTAPVGVSPSFPQGYLIHIDPELEAKNDDFVIAKIKNEEIVFKQLKFEEGRYYLKSLNPSFDVIFSKFDILGVVVAASQQFK